MLVKSLRRKLKKVIYLICWNNDHGSGALSRKEQRRGIGAFSSLQWRNNECFGVSNHRRLDCLLNRLYRHRAKKNQSSESLAFVRGIHWWPVDSPHKDPVTRKMFLSYNVIMFRLVFKSPNALIRHIHKSCVKRGHLRWLIPSVY